MRKRKIISALFDLIISLTMEGIILCKIVGVF